MKQFKLTFVLIILISMVGLQAFAASGKVRVGGLYYYLEGNQAQLAQGLFGYDGAIVIPSEITYNGYKYSVTSIGEYAFYECYDLTSVTIPNSVTWIAYNAFWFCPNLTSVTLNSNAIVSQSYTESYSIKRYLGEQVNSYIIGDDVRSIGEYAFSGCSALTSITIGNSVTSIGQDAFKNTALTKVIVNDIAAWCKISFRNGYSNPLYFANHLYSDENTEVTDLVIPNSVTSVNFAAFLGCSMLTSVIIPNSVTSIGKSAFAYCTGLNSVTIGNNVTSIGDYTFAGCYNLTSVTVLNPTPVAITQNVFTDHRKRATLYVPKGSKEAYEAADYWKEFKEIIEIEVSGIDQIMTDEEGKAKIFTLDGRRISKPQKGINIIGGKKVVVK